MNANATLIETLRHSEVYQRYERAYTEATGLPIALRAVETWRLPLHGKRNENPFCASVAATSNACVFHFCNLFHKATGVTFTEFLSRTWVKKARNLLFNPNLRVSEIAYDVGFQSLTQFNRIFRTVVGESPTEYRGHLPKTRCAARFRGD